MAETHTYKYVETIDEHAMFIWSSDDAAPVVSKRVPAKTFFRTRVDGLVLKGRSVHVIRLKLCCLLHTAFL